MRIAFMGKWWSGKTTLCTVFTKFLQKKSLESLLVFDVDINSHLLEWFGIDKKDIPYMINDFEKIAHILEPNYKEKWWFNEFPAFGTIMPNEDTHFIIPWSAHPILDSYGISKENVTFFSLGTHVHSKGIEWVCYHGFLNTYELILHRIIDDNKSFVLADTTAWIDNLGTSLYAAYDMVFFVVEPTYKSISVYLDYIKNSHVDVSKVYVLANKVENEEDLFFLEKYIDKSRVIASFAKDKKIYKDQDSNAYDAFILKYNDTLESMYLLALNQKKDRYAYYNAVYELFKKESEGWFSDYYHVDFLSKMPENYSFITKFPSQWE